MANYYVKGYTPPAGIKSTEDVKRKQKELGVKVDGIWGPNTQAAYDKQSSSFKQYGTRGKKTYSPPKGIDSVSEIKDAQRRLGVTVDGIWGEKTEAAWTNMRNSGNKSINLTFTTSNDNAKQDNNDSFSKPKYSAPKGIDSVEEIKQTQRHLGVTVDGVWGSETQNAWNAMRSGGKQSIFTAPKGINTEKEIKQTQQRLGVSESGIWDRSTNDAWETMRSGGKISESKYTAKGFTAPEGVDSSTDVRNIQKVLGVKQSGIWDATTQSAWKNQFGELWTPNKDNEYVPPKGIDSPEEIKQVQSRLGVTSDGVWGKETQNAWERMKGANTAATFTKAVIDKGKTSDDNYGNESLTRYQREKVEQTRQNVDWQLRKTPFAKKADVFLQRELSEKRSEQDNKGIGAMAKLYSLFVSRGENKDAQNILAHLKAYNEKAINSKDISQDNKSLLGRSGHRYDANDTRLQLARDLDLGIYDQMPAFENGNVVIDVYDGVPLFGLNDEQKQASQKITEDIIDLGFGVIPYVGWLGSVASLGREFQLESYFEAFPEAILQKGDVVVYYSSNEAGINGSEYAFRNGELLYEDHRFSGGETILGKNYMKYASEYKAKTNEEAFGNFVEGEAQGILIDYYIKNLIS